MNIDKEDKVLLIWAVIAGLVLCVIVVCETVERVFNGKAERRIQKVHEVPVGESAANP
jgi:hypothetical protein